jgi:hypothetical protein
MPQRLLILFLLLGLFSACESEKKDDPAPPTIITDSITLNELQIQGDSVANLTWSALNNPDFVEYRVIRKEGNAETVSESATFPIKAQLLAATATGICRTPPTCSIRLWGCWHRALPLKATW